MFVPGDCGNPSRFFKKTWWGGVGITPHPCVRATGGYPLPPFGPIRPETTNQKRPQAKPLRRSFHANIPAFPVQKRQACRIRWWGGGPHPLPLCPGKWGVPTLAWYWTGGGTLPPSGRIGRGFRNRSGYC